MFKGNLVPLPVMTIPESARQSTVNPDASDGQLGSVVLRE